MKPEYLVGLLGTTVLAACSQTAGVNTTESITTPAASSPALMVEAVAASGEQLLALDANHWLSTGRKTGMQLTSDQQPLVLPSAGSKFLDYRQNGTQTRTITLNAHKQLQLTTFNTDGQAMMASSQPLNWAVEGLCLYQPDANQNLQLFVLDDRAMAHQLVLKPQADQLQWQELRQFPLPPQAEHCRVDDLTARFFVSEENMGVWSYNARSESEIVRNAVDMVAPWGNLQKSAGPVAIVNGELLVAEPGYLHRYRINQTGTDSGQHYQLPANSVPDSLQANQINQQLVISWMDDDDGKLYSTRFNAPASSTRHHNAIAEIVAAAETAPMNTEGDAADDPAIWINKAQPSKSRILGTNKQQGLMVYDLQGNNLQQLAAGRVNNVDVRQDFRLRGKATDIASASQRDEHAISLFAIDPHTGEVSAAGSITTGLTDVYGLCMYQQKQDVFVFINDQDGRFEQWQIIDTPQGWQGRLRRQFAVATQPEGCAADDQQQRLFIGEEDVAIWTLSANPDASTQMQRVASVGDWLQDDIEGMDIYHGSNATSLVVSSQGNDSYVVLDANPPFQPVARFRIGLNAERGIDGASETDGLTVTSVNLGADYPQGLLVVQDGRNLLPDEAQNFKLVDWREVARLLPEKP